MKMFVVEKVDGVTAVEEIEMCSCTNEDGMVNSFIEYDVEDVDGKTFSYFDTGDYKDHFYKSDDDVTKLYSLEDNTILNSTEKPYMTFTVFLKELIMLIYNYIINDEESIKWYRSKAIGSISTNGKIIISSDNILYGITKNLIQYMYHKQMITKGPYQDLFNSYTITRYDEIISNVGIMRFGSNVFEDYCVLKLHKSTKDKIVKDIVLFNNLNKMNEKMSIKKIGIEEAIPKIMEHVLERKKGDKNYE